MNLRKFQRQTYSILDWLGDIGGLYDSLFIILSFALSPVAAFKLQQTMLTKLFRVIKSNLDLKLSEYETELMQSITNANGILYIP